MNYRLLLAVRRVAGFFVAKTMINSDDARNLQRPAGALTMVKGIVEG